MDEEIINQLRTYGWTEGYHIPIANEENRLLASQIEEALKKKTQVDSLLEDTNNNYQCLTDFNENIKEQRAQNEHILYDYKKQLEHEKQSANELRFEKESLVHDIKTMNQETSRLTEENKRLQTELDNITKECEKLKKGIEWSKDMESLIDENLNEENNLITVLDENKLKNDIEFERVELKRLKLLSELREYEQLLKQKETEVVSAEYQLEKLTTLIESTQKERQWLITQWENSVKTLRNRDEEIENIMKDVSILQSISRHSATEILEQKSFFEELERNNMEVEATIHQILRDIASQQEVNGNLTKAIELKSNEQIDYRKELESLGARSSEEEALNTQLQREINSKISIANTLSNDCEKCSQLLKNLGSRSVSAVDRIKQLEQILQGEKRQLSSVTQERQKYDRSLHNLRCQKADLETKNNQVQSELKQIENLRDRLLRTIEDLEENIERHAETANSIELEIKETASKINYLKEDKSEKLKLELENKISKLNTEYDRKKKTLDMVLAEVNKCNNEIKILNKEMNTCMEKLKKLEEHKKEINLQIEADEKHLNKIIEENKDKEVTDNMLRLKASHLVDAVNKAGEAVFSLEKQKVELETLLRERLLKIDTSTNLLKMRKKALLDNISSLKKNIDQTNAHTNQLIKKYEIIMDTTAKDKNGDRMTITNYKLQLIKERYSLIEKGDDLDEKIKKTEKEIQAMENTLLLMNTCNKTYKESVSSVDTNSKEYKEKEMSEKEYHRLVKAFKKHKRIIPELKADIEQLKTKTSEIQSERQQMENVNRAKQQELCRLDHDINEQQIKLERVESRIKLLRKSLKKTNNIDLIERNYLSKELQNVNKSVLCCISELMMEYPETEIKMTRYLTERGILLPKKKSKNRKFQSTTPSELSISCSKLSCTDDDEYTAASVTSSSGCKDSSNFDFKSTK